MTSCPTGANRPLPPPADAIQWRRRYSAEERQFFNLAANRRESPLIWRLSHSHRSFLCSLFLFQLTHLAVYFLYRFLFLLFLYRLHFLNFSPLLIKFKPTSIFKSINTGSLFSCFCLTLSVGNRIFLSVLFHFQLTHLGNFRCTSGGDYNYYLFSSRETSAPAAKRLLVTSLQSIHY